MKLTDKQKRIIEEAYNRYLKYIEPEEQKLKYKNLEIALNEFKGKLRRWKASDNVDFIIDFALSKEAQIFASVKVGQIFIDDFKMFLNKKSIREELEKMIYYKFNIDDDAQEHFSISKHDIIDFLEKQEKVDKEEFKLGRPKILTGRLVLMMFTELYTSIADIDALKNVCKKLDNPFLKNDRYLAKHRQIRCMTDTYLIENNLYEGLTDLDRGRIGWFVTEI
ncbi:hypothetical protein [Clostridium sp. BL-8]|uniref:hypothetical protein n=1 Tax=Clostridium sp. BL-8 TaxID=349938 RepID=UPI00098CE16A|nr:hypothetical protein [Clostridium sp. BL-8]OOM78804.1 hypothetical protein CLOBL_20520 [Clostridium sp. BL-8]